MCASVARGPPWCCCMVSARSLRPVPQARLTMPVLAVGGEKSFGENEAIVMRNAADKVTQVVIPGAGHWLMEEAPTQTIRAIRDFIAQ